MRNSQEVLHIYGYNDNLYDKAGVHNPAFDVTPSEFLTGIITEKGIIKQTISKNLQKFIQRKNYWSTKIIQTRKITRKF